MNSPTIPGRIFTTKKILAAISAILIVFIVLGAALHLRTPIIKASNIERFNNEISSNAPIIIAFNQLMNRSSTEENFGIEPIVGGKFKWFMNEMRFVPDERLTVNQTYAVTISAAAKNILGKHLAEDKTLFFTVVDPPKVTLAVPNDETDVDSKITVMFDRPMTEFTTYDVAESRNFPMEITPALTGRFKWIGTSAFQYIPQDKLAYSTIYTVTIPAGTPSLDGGKLEGAHTFTFATPRIQKTGELAQMISAKDPFVLRFNQPVNLESLLEHVTIKNKENAKIELKAAYAKRKEMTFKDGKEIEKEIEDKAIAELLPEKNDWGYDNGYEFSMAKGVSGLEGNLASENEFKNVKFATAKFLHNTYPEDKNDNTDPYAKITLYFDQEVSPSAALDNFKIEPAAEFTASYGKKCDPKWEPKESPDEKCSEIADLNVVVLAPREKLKNLTQYKVTIDKSLRAKNGLAYLKEDYKWSFTTADVFKILRSDPAEENTGSYKRICLFATTLADTKELEKLVEFSPKQKGKITVSSYQLGDSHYYPEPYSEMAYEDEYSYSDDQTRCKKQDKNEHYALQIEALLDPSTQHKITLKAGSKDTFGQTLGADFALNFKTRSLKDGDTDLSILQDKFYATATLDQHAAPVFAAENLQEFDLEICSISAEKFMEVETEYMRKRDELQGKRYYELGWQGFAPSEENCHEYKKVSKKLKNAYWEKQYAEVNLSDDLGGKALAGYYYLRASSPRVYNTERIYTYSETQKRDIVSGIRKIPVRPDQILNLTNLHVTLKRSKENALFWATYLSTGQPATGVKISLYTETGSPLPESSITDKNGIAKRELHDLPFKYAIAQAGNERMIVDADWNQGISPWDYRLDYWTKQRYTQGYVYTDRPLYQPTHEVFFKGILRDDDDAALRLPEKTTIDVRISDSRDSSIYKKTLAISKQGTFSDSLKLDESAPLGRYSIDACIKRDAKYGDCTGGGFYQSFYVEKYRKPEYKLEVSYNEEDYVDKDEMRALIDGQYFFGAPVTGGKVDWSIRAQNYYFDEYDGEWFSFTDFETYRKCYFGCPYADEYLANGTGELDENGKLLVTNKLDLSAKNEKGEKQPPDSSKIYTLEATVQDKNNQSVAGRKEIAVHRGEFYVGVKNEKYIVGVNEEMPIKVIAVDRKGQGLSGKSIKLELLKVNWKYVKKKHLDGGFYWENEMELKPVKTTTLGTDSDGKASYGFKMSEGGEYVAKATGEDSRGNKFSSTADFYVTTQETVSWKQENNNRMELKLDKVSYEVGETAKVLVKSPYAKVKALLTYERGDVFENRVIDIDSNAHAIEVPITEKMIPNFYISVLEVKAGNREDPPDFKLGYANTVVDAKNKELAISIKADKKFYQPRERVNLEIATTDQKGNPASADVSIAVVDASLLALKGNPKRDLVNVFYNRRSLGVLTSDNLTNFLERINLSDLKGAKGGGGKGADEFGKPRGKFEDTAFWRGSLQTDANGKLLTSFALPDNLTTWNIEAVGATANSLFGSTNETITTKKPVMVRPLLPRFALFNDEIKLGAIVHNFTDSAGSFTVSIDTKNLAVKDSSSKKIRIATEGSEKVLFNVLVPKVKNNTIAEITLRAEGNGQNDAVIQTFPILSYSTPESVALSSFTDDISFTEKVLLPESVDQELGELKITTGATLATYISDSLNYLLSFPYGCTEQILSQIVPNIVLKNAVSIPGFQDKIKLAQLYDENRKPITFDAMVIKNLQKLYEFQRPEGGFGYFAGSRESHPYLTAYAVFGLHNIKKAGYAVDGRTISRATAYLQDYMNNNKDLKDTRTGKLRKKDFVWANNRSYMLFVMAETDLGDIGLTNSLYEDRELLSNSGSMYFAMALHKLNPDSTHKTAELIKTLENQARIETRGTYIRNNSGGSFDMMTHVKTTALAIQTLNRINPNHPLLPKLIHWLIKNRKDGRWQTTQDNAAALIALAEYLETNKETQANYEAKIAIDGKEALQYSVNGKNILNQQEITRSLTEFKRGMDGTKVVFSKDGEGRIYYDMVLRYFLPIDKIAPRGEEFNIERNYYRLDDKKLERPITEAHAGETLRGHLTIIAPEERHAVAVENFLPAGFELVNFEFETSATQTLDKNLEETTKNYYDDGYYRNSYYWNHKELRDDRLFLFADNLPKGVYEYDYYVQVTSEGKFHHPPAVVSEMYYPENFGRTKGEWLEVKRF